MLYSIVCILYSTVLYTVLYCKYSFVYTQQHTSHPMAREKYDRRPFDTCADVKAHRPFVGPKVLPKAEPHFLLAPDTRVVFDAFAHLKSLLFPFELRVDAFICGHVPQFPVCPVRRFNRRIILILQ